MTDVTAKLREVLNIIVEEQEFPNSEIVLKPLSTGGANFTSLLFTVTLSAPGKDDLELFAKVAVIADQMRAILEVQVFETEVTFYTKVLPKFRELEEVHNFPEEDRFVAPKYYGGSIEYKNELLVLEELTSKGYEWFDRKKCFDWEYASESVAALARFHAFSVAYERDEPETFSAMVKKLKFSLPYDEMRELLIKSIENAVEAIDDVNKKRIEKRLHNDLEEKTFLKYFEAKRRLVLSHGDFKPSNILHKRCEDGTLKLAFVDYQMMQLGNPLYDLMLFLINGSDEEFRAKHFHQYFNHYYDVFSKTLRRLGIDPDDVYTEKDYRDDIKEILPCGLFVGMYTLPFNTVDAESAPKLEEGIDIEQFNVETSDLFRERFNGLVKDYIKFGII